MQKIIWQHNLHNTLKINYNEKILPAIALFVGVLTVQSQSDFALKSDVPSHVYILPKTGLCFEIEVETTQRNPVSFIFIQRYLATNELSWKKRLVLQSQILR